MNKPEPTIVETKEGKLKILPIDRNRFYVVNFTNKFQTGYYSGAGVAKLIRRNNEDRRLRSSDDRNDLNR